MQNVEKSDQIRRVGDSSAQQSIEYEAVESGDAAEIEGQTSEHPRRVEFFVSAFEVDVLVNGVSDPDVIGIVGFELRACVIEEVSRGHVLQRLSQEFGLEDARKEGFASGFREVSLAQTHLLVPGGVAEGTVYVPDNDDSGEWRDSKL